MPTEISDRELSSLVARVVQDLSGAPDAQGSQRSVSIGADHRGQELKALIVDLLREKAYRVLDRSNPGSGSSDYPDIAEAVALDVVQGRAWRGIVIDGAGIGSCMAANKVPGGRAALCYNQATARNSREHNDANILSLGSGLTGPALAQAILEAWLETPFAGGRHARRVDKLTAIERRHSLPK
jgi:ribose 5-phosphate isomerase B